MSFFSTSIPTPVDPNHFQPLGYVRLGYDDIDIYWRRTESQVLFNRGDTWFLQPNDNIRKSLATLMGCLERDIVTILLALFENRRFYATDAGTQEGFLDCEWSDFAHDFMILRANVQHRNNAPLHESGVRKPPVLDDILKSPPHIRRLPFFM
jgi:hypothetical protein